MKTGKTHFTKTIIVTVLLALANHSHALYTNFLNDAVGALTAQYNTLTSNPTPTRMERQAIARIQHAFKDLSKPSTSVAGDYNLFLAAALHLGPIAFSPDFAPIGSNVFKAFTNEAQAEIFATQARIAALSDFVRVKRAASTQITQAQGSLNGISSLTDPRLALIVGRLVFAKIVVANKLAAIGEAHPGFAPDSVVGKTITHHENGKTGMVHFDDATNATQTHNDGSMDTSSYTWTRTGLSTATLVVHEPCDGGGTGTTTVKIHFTSATGGTFSAHDVECDGSTHNQAGTFTID
jgi:hypothetical protein